MIVILKIFHWCVFWILPCNGSLFEHVGLEEGSSPVLLLSLLKWLCEFGTRGHVQVVTAPTLAVPCRGETFPLHVEPRLWLCASGTWCPTPLSPGVPGPGMVRGRAAWGDLILCMCSSTSLICLWEWVVLPKRVLCHVWKRSGDLLWHSLSVIRLSKAVLTLTVNVTLAKSSLIFFPPAKKHNGNKKDLYEYNLILYFQLRLSGQWKDI